MKSIVERGEIYEAQLKPIEEILSSFSLSYGWELGNYGRRPNVGIFGKVGMSDANVLIESRESDWEILPDKLDSDFAFHLWSSIWRDTEKGRETANAYLFWSATFSQLEKVVPRFLDSVSSMHTEVGNGVEFLFRTRPVSNPDVGPNFGGVRRYET
ncbi:hypothetical protein [Sessilibacter sp. MAH2]